MARKAYEPRPCPVCGTEFTPIHPSKRHCSPACRDKARPPKSAIRAKKEAEAGYTQRKCLSCLGMFSSEWVGNRICPTCKANR